MNQFQFLVIHPCGHKSTITGFGDTRDEALETLLFIYPTEEGFEISPV